MEQVIIILIFLSLGVVYSANTYTHISEGFYIHSTNILTEELFGGNKIFPNIPKECIICEKNPLITSGHSYYNNTAFFYHALTTTSSISGGLEADFTLGLTLDITSKSITGTNREVRGSTLDILSYSEMCVFSENCYALSINANLLQDFEKLSLVIKEEWKKSSWLEYDLFLQKYGSHMISATQYGSRIYQHCFSEYTQQYTSKSLSVRACLDFGAGVGVDLGVKVCAGITTEQAKQANNLTASSLLILRGGSNDTRSKLFSSRSEELIEKFLNEANISDMPIQYKFTSIWSILQRRYIGTEHMGKVNNLEAYYIGYNNFNCQFIPEINPTMLGALQKFELVVSSNPQLPSYRCVIPPEGCHEYYQDCHYRVAFRCECKGDGCIHHYQKTLDTGIYKTYAEPYLQSEWEWHGCSLHGLKCYCDAPNWNWVAIWEQDNNYELLMLNSKFNNISSSVKSKHVERLML